MKQIPLFKSILKKQDYNAIQKSLKTGWLTHGSNNLVFEKKFRKLIGTNTQYQ